MGSLARRAAQFNRRTAPRPSRRPLWSLLRMGIITLTERLAPFYAHPRFIEEELMSKSITNHVNFDSLIPRADIFAEPTLTTANTPVIRITDLEPGITYDMLRKPDFQRETANWRPDQIKRLIETFCDSDIIPAVILWQNGSQVFVVDGAHRLSALIAWIRHDYGGGELSQKFYQGHIPEKQRILHDETAKLVEDSIGTWDEYKKRTPL